MKITVDELSPAAIRAGLARFFDDGGDEHFARRVTDWRLYRGDHAMLEAEVHKYFPRGFLAELHLPICAQNPAKKIINSRFISYRLPPERTYPDGLSDLENGIDHHMRQLELSVGALGKDALLIRWDAEDKRFVYFVLRKYVEIYLPGDLTPQGVAYPVHDSGKTKDSECMWAVWTDALSFYVGANAGGVLPNDDGTEDNPYGVVPVLLAYRDDEESEALKDVLNAQAWHNWIMTLAGHGCLLQGLGVPWKNGMPPQQGEKETVSPYAVQFTEAGGFGFATSGIDLEKLPRVAREYLNSAAFSHHLRMNWAGDSMASSGEHQRLLESDLSIAVQADNLKWAGIEAQRVDVEAIMLDKLGVRIGGIEEFSVNFRESHLPMSERERFELWKMEMDASLSTRAKYMQLKDPDLDEESAVAKVQAIDEQRATLTDTGPQQAAQPAPRASLLAQALAR